MTAPSTRHSRAPTGDQHGLSLSHRSRQGVHRLDTLPAFKVRQGQKHMFILCCIICCLTRQNAGEMPSALSGATDVKLRAIFERVGTF